MLNNTPIFSAIAENIDDKINPVIPQIAEKLNSLEEIEGKIQVCLTVLQKTFYELALLFKEIKDRELYLALGYKGFLEYCYDKWGKKKTYVYDLIRAAEVGQNLIGEKITSDNFSAIAEKLKYNLPTKESQCRELAKLKDSQLQQQAWEKAIAINKNPTAAVIKLVVKELEKGENNNPTRKLELNTVVRIVGNNPEIKHLHNCWGVVTATHENSYSVKTCLSNATALHSQYLMELQECDFAMAEKIIERVKAIASSDRINYTVRDLLNAIATQPFPELNEWQELYLRETEKQLIGG